MNAVLARKVVGTGGRLFAFVAMLGSVPMNGAEPTATVPDLAPLVQANNRFACDLYGKLRSEKGNLFFSPSSIFTALGMTTAGTRGETATQMRTVLQLLSAGSTLEGDQFHTAAAGLIKRLNDGGKGGTYQLTVANRLWGQQGFPFLAPFLELLRDKYGAEMTALDFKNAEASRQTIHAWVATATNDKIKDLIPDGALNSLTRLVLTNAVYFKGTWETVFRQDATRPMPFHLAAANSVDVPTMFQNEHHPFIHISLGDNKGLKVLQLAYKAGPAGDKGLSMILLLPDDAAGLADLEPQLTAENLNKWSTGLNRQEVRIWLPKFKLTSQFGLNEVLSALGMPLAFNPEKADFSGIDGRHDLYISDVFHKAYVDVYEEGTEAAAATGVIVALRAMPASPPEFRADHPFVFAIRDEATGCILFLGRVIDPR